MSETTKTETSRELQEILEALHKMSARISDIEKATHTGNQSVEKIATSVGAIATQQKEETTSVASIAQSIGQYTGAVMKATTDDRRARHQWLSDQFWTAGGTHYPDISEWYPQVATDTDKDAIDAKNILRERMYDALIFIFSQRFSFPAPSFSAESFTMWQPHVTADLTRFLGVHGLLLADNFTDPLLLRPAGTTFNDDVLGEVRVSEWDGNRQRPGFPLKVREVRVARRFFDAAVASVQTYTAKADLFTRVREQLQRKSVLPTGGSSISVSGRP